MLKEKIQDSLNQQVNAELYSAYLYYAMAAYCEDQGLSGCAHWMRLQALEEVTHAQKIAAYVVERGGRAVMKGIAEPPREWDSVPAMFQAVLEHERHVSDLINKLVDLAIEKSDHATNNFLQWFVAEQVEEEASAEEILQKLELVKASPHGLFMLDRELAQRQFTPPPGFFGGSV
jgi:ferritin